MNWNPINKEDLFSQLEEILDLEIKLTRQWKYANVPHHLFCVCLWLSFLMLIDLEGFWHFKSAIVMTTLPTMRLTSKSISWGVPVAVLHSYKAYVLKTSRMLPVRSKTVCTAKNNQLSKDSFNWNWDLTKLLKLGLYKCFSKAWY